MGKQENKSMAEIEPRPHSEDSDRRSPSLPGSKQDSNRRSRRWKIRALTHDVVFLPQSHSPSPQSEFDTPGSGASGTDGSRTLPRREMDSNYLYRAAASFAVAGCSS